MSDGLLFANSRAKAKENDLFSNERLTRMLEADTFIEAVKILQEVNYGGVVLESVYDYPIMLKNEENLARQFIKETAPQKLGIECFFIKTDYFNLKALFKSRLTGLDIPLIDGGSIDTDVLKRQFAVGKLEDESLQIAYDTISEDVEINGANGRRIDTLTDHAMFKKISTLINIKGVDPLIKKYFVSLIDLTNIDILLRFATMQMDSSAYQLEFINGGGIPQAELLPLYDDMVKLKSYIGKSNYPKLVDSLDSIVSFEKAKDDYLLDIFTSQKYEMFGVAPLIGYYLARMTEITSIRIILVCKKNSVSKDDIKRRLRKLYV